MDRKPAYIVGTDGQLAKRSDVMSKEELYLKLKLARTKGEFIGTLQGILWWDIPEELKEKLENKIKELEKEQKNDH